VLKLTVPGEFHDRKAADGRATGLQAGRLG
jgi:hypothetical protein